MEGGGIIMANRYGVRERGMALRLYLEGYSLTRIEKATGIPIFTISNWCKRYNWQGKLGEYAQKAENIMVESSFNIKKKELHKIEEMVEYLTNELKVAKLPTKDKLVSNIIEYQKLALLLKGVATDSKKVEVEHSGNVSVKLEDLL
jgi:hypothetical protein